ncbi:Fur family transcriptional regulator [Jannaschia pagri]|uniref:Fur family transcriptional regulator n=1 Tax=Jannaschia pagri TaxID=2829797 RepID=A0ABQ4NHB0_9RHOB|nr:MULTISPECIES: Fur family transcriptional regulator [unclassified Jannaschia]GIT90094.1 Fur family transcriptional regulator [Jannaschia sp. AI_61]GIT93800.1 Fur family transcriptional regulator [Jannaschia sp. AI_62]
MTSDSKDAIRSGTTESGAIGFSSHDHAICVASALGAADRRSAAEGLRLTPVRRKTLEVLLRAHKAMGAYAILDELRAAGFGSQPPVAYRALEFLAAHGFVHKIERLNAFVACVDPGCRQDPAFMICKVCDAVAEAPLEPLRQVLGSVASAAGFEIERTVVETVGVCSKCAEAAR